MHRDKRQQGRSSLRRLQRMHLVTLYTSGFSLILVDRLKPLFLTNRYEAKIIKYRQNSKVSIHNYFQNKTRPDKKAHSTGSSTCTRSIEARLHQYSNVMDTTLWLKFEQGQAYSLLWMVRQKTIWFVNVSLHSTLNNV